MLEIECTHIGGQRPIVQDHSVDAPPEIGREHRQVLAGRIPISLSWLGHEIAHVHARGMARNQGLLHTWM